MTHQPSFAQAEFATKKKVTRRETFLAPSGLLLGGELGVGETGPVRQACSLETTRLAVCIKSMNDGLFQRLLSNIT